MKLFGRVLGLAAILAASAGVANAQISQNFIGNFPDNTAIPPGSVTVVMSYPDGSVVLPLIAETVPGLTDFVGRPKFDARTGGAFADQDMKDLVIKYNDLSGNEHVVNYANTAGGADGWKESHNVAGAVPALQGDGWVRVGYDAIGGQTNDVAWDTLYNGNYTAAIMDFDIRIQSGNPAVTDRADGFGFGYVNAAAHGNTGAFYSGGEEPSMTGLGIGFDIWDNGGEGGNSVSLHYNGTPIKSVDLATLTPSGSLETGDTIHVNVTVTPGGSILPDSVVGGSTYTASRHGSGGGLVPVVIPQQFGTHDAFFRLTDDVNSQHNFIAFDAVANAGSRPVFGGRTGGANQEADLDNIDIDYAVGSVQASFDIRMTKTGDPADGVSFLLAPTDTFGSTGAIDVVNDLSGTTGVNWDVAEDPRLAGALGIGFKTFDEDELRIRFNGVDVANVPVDDAGEIIPTTFVDGNWHHVVVNVTDQGPDALVTVTYDNILAYSGVVAGAAGLGLVPEPATAGGLIFAALGLADVVRRRRK